MKQRKILLAAAVLAAVCCACTYFSHRIYTNAGHTAVERVRGEGFSAVVHMPESSRPGNPAPGVLVVGENLLTRRALASELSRRGYVAAAVSARQAEAALNWMTRQDRILAERLALVGRGEDILPLQTETGNIQAAVGLGFDTLPGEASEYNCLLFAADAPSAEELAHFLCCEESKAELGRIRGYFMSENARCLYLTDGRPAFRDEDVQIRLFDWLGSSLGHRIELPDDYQQWPAMETLTFLALLSGSLSACLFLCLLGKNTHQPVFRED